MYNLHPKKCNLHPKKCNLHPKKCKFLQHNLHSKTCNKLKNENVKLHEIDLSGEVVVAAVVEDDWHFARLRDGAVAGATDGLDVLTGPVSVVEDLPIEGLLAYLAHLVEA